MRMAHASTRSICWRRKERWLSCDCLLVMARICGKLVVVFLPDIDTAQAKPAQALLEPLAQIADRIDASLGADAQREYRALAHAARSRAQQFNGKLPCGSGSRCLIARMISTISLRALGASRWSH